MPQRPAPGSAPAAAARRTMRSATVVFTLTLLLGIQPIATDLYLPALPAIGVAFGAGVGAVQMTLSALIIAFGVAQLAWGPLADRYGRRPVLLAGLALFTLAGIGAALAASVAALVGWRALQGCGMAAAVTCGRSVIRDLYAPEEGARVMSRAMGGLGVLALLSPLTGGVMAQWLGWRGALGAVALFGAASLAWIVWRFEETVSRKNPRATMPMEIARNWRAIATHPTFVAWTMLLCASYGGLFVMLASSSFVFLQVLGLSRLEYSLFLASNSVAYISGTLLCRRWLARRPPQRVVRRGAFCSLAGGALIAGLSLAGVQSVWAIVLPQWLYAVGHGIHQPCGQSGSVGPFSERAGTAASLSGFAMMVVAFAVGVGLGRTMNGTVYPLTLGVGAFAAVVALVAWTLVQRHGAARPPAVALAAEMTV
jgi:DHA1 family bicyclomycin/chloramphenicol resistance-like MFS transporter